MTIDLIPNFPSEDGPENGIEFTKDEQLYRIVRVGDSSWVIHRRGASADEFEIRLHGDGGFFDVEGRNGLTVVHGMGAPLNTIFTKMF